MKRKTETIVAPKLTDAQEIAMRMATVEEFEDFVYLFLESMVEQLNNLPPSKQYAMMKHKDNEVSLRQQLIIEFRRQMDLYENMSDELKFTNYRRFVYDKNTDTNKLQFQIKLPEELGYKLLWINDGTGIFDESEGATKEPIVAVNKRYMFIPGARFTASYYARKEKKSGYNTYGQFTSGIKGKW